MTTPLDELSATLRASASYAAGAEAPPEAILWCDPGRDFAPVLPALRARLPQLLTLGAYDPSTRTGPAIWLRAAAGRHVPGIGWCAEEPPIIYLPAVGREVLRGAEDCDPSLQPLVWYAVAGTFFGQRHQSRDWTLRGFLSAQGSTVGIDVPDDAATRTALARAAPRLFAEPVATLKGRRWDALALDGLLVPDPVQDMLLWMDGKLTEAEDPERFAAFAARAAKDFGLDPRKKSQQDAAARLARLEGPWTSVWNRFEAMGGAAEGVVRLLACEEPQDLMADLAAYPRTNEAKEGELRRALLALASATPDKAVESIRALERDHAWRRDTVWAKRGEARLALALRHLAVVTEAAPLPAHAPAAMADAYVEIGWRADAAALAALDIARTGEDREAVAAALRAVYLPWVEAGATALQGLAASGVLRFAAPSKTSAPPKRAVLLFVDGLRLDLAQKLAEMLRARRASATLNWVWSGFPSVTATCKPLVSPAAGLLAAGPVNDLRPTFEGKATTQPVLLKAIEAAGWSTVQNLLGEEPIWRECGRFDEEGHALGARLAERITDGLAEVADTALRLAGQGRPVRIVTDHGWLLMPGGLPHAPLEAGLTAPSGKGHRMARMKPGAPTTYTRLPWTWDAAEDFAVATGIRVFFNGVEYAHGGVSPQECVLPVLDIGAESTAPQVKIDATWKRLMLKVKVTGGAGLMIDACLGPDTTGPSVLAKGARPLDDAGEASLGADYDFEGKEACLVVYPANERHKVLAKLRTVVGG